MAQLETVSAFGRLPHLFNGTVAMGHSITKTFAIIACILITISQPVVRHNVHIHEILIG